MRYLLASFTQKQPLSPNSPLSSYFASSVLHFFFILAQLLHKLPLPSRPFPPPIFFSFSLFSTTTSISSSTTTPSFSPSLQPPHFSPSPPPPLSPPPFRLLPLASPPLRPPSRSPSPYAPSFPLSPRRLTTPS